MLPKEALPSFLCFMKRKLHVVYCNLPQLLTNFNEFSEIYNYFVKREANSSKKDIVQELNSHAISLFLLNLCMEAAGLLGAPPLDAVIAVFI